MSRVINLGSRVLPVALSGPCSSGNDPPPNGVNRSGDEVTKRRWTVYSPGGSRLSADPRLRWERGPLSALREGTVNGPSEDMLEVNAVRIVHLSYSGNEKIS